MKNERGWYRIPPRWFLYGKRKLKIFFFGVLPFLLVFVREFLLFFFKGALPRDIRTRQLRVIKIFAQSLCVQKPFDQLWGRGFPGKLCARAIACFWCSSRQMLIDFLSDDWQRLKKFGDWFWFSQIVPLEILMMLWLIFKFGSSLWCCVVLFRVLVSNYFKYVLAVSRQRLKHHQNHHQNHSLFENTATTWYSLARVLLLLYYY